MKTKIIILLAMFFTNCLVAAPTPSEVNAILTKYANNPKGWSALNYAIEQKDYDAAIILLDYVRDFNKVDDHFNALCRIMNNATKSTSKKLTKEERTLIDKALEKGLDFVSMESSGQWPLGCAIKLNDKDLVIKLLNKGANPNKGMSACFNGKHWNYDIMKLLIEYGADVNADADGTLPLCRAIETLDYDIVKLLVENGANVNENNGRPLYFAVIRSSYKITKLLIEHGADVEAKGVGAYPNPPLTWSVFVGDVKTVQLLLKNGANPNSSITYQGYDSILSLALSKNKELAISASAEIVDLLLQHGAKLA